MRLESTRSASTNLDAIANYIAQDNPDAAEKVFQTILVAVYRQVDFSEMGRVGRLPGTREVTVVGLPYFVVYHVAGDVIVVVAIFHQARDPARALAERGTDVHVNK